MKVHVDFNEKLITDRVVRRFSDHSGGCGVRLLASQGEESSLQELRAAIAHHYLLVPSDGIAHKAMNLPDGIIQLLVHIPRPSQLPKWLLHEVAHQGICVANIDMVVPLWLPEALEHQRVTTATFMKQINHPTIIQEMISSHV